MECLGNPEVKGGMCTQYKNMRMSIQMITEVHKCLWIEHKKKKIIIVKPQYIDKVGKEMEEEECKNPGEVRWDCKWCYVSVKGMILI